MILKIANNNFLCLNIRGNHTEKVLLRAFSRWDSGGKQSMFFLNPSFLGSWIWEKIIGDILQLLPRGCLLVNFQNVCVLDVEWDHHSSPRIYLHLKLWRGPGKMYLWKNERLTAGFSPSWEPGGADVPLETLSSFFSGATLPFFPALFGAILRLGWWGDGLTPEGNRWKADEIDPWPENFPPFIQSAIL